MNLLRGLSCRVSRLEPLKHKTTFKMGGRAKFFCQPKTIKDLKLLTALAKKSNLPVFILGAGSNILVSDKGVNGLVLQLSSRCFRKIAVKGNYLEAGAGIMLGELIKKSLQNNLSGLEFAAGIPGTLGGALAMNAGAWGKNIGNLVTEATVMDYNGNIKNLKKNRIKFKYRRSSLAKYIILGASLKLTKKNKDKIKAAINKYLSFRRSLQDCSFPNAGCVFKNPSGKSAGRLIDLCGLKGKNIGGAFISLRHANFILNRANASSDEVLKLMGLIKSKVRHKFKVNLEPEIKIWN